jgi:hypothetical protein
MSNKSENEAQYEIALRGATLETAIKFEVLLVVIIYFSNSKQYVTPKESKSLKVKRMTFGSKIDWVKELLSEFHPDLLTKYNQLFIDLDSFLKLRNKMAHCAIAWVDEKLDSFEIWDAIEDSNKFQFFTPTVHTRMEISQSIIDFLYKISTPLLALQNEVKLRLKQTDPKLHDSLISAL